MLRAVSVTVPVSEREALRSLLAEHDVLGNWQQEVKGERMLVQLLVRTPDAEPLLDLLEQRFGRDEAFRAVLFRVHATIPAIPEPEKDEEPDKPPPGRVARAEIQNELAAGIDVGPVFLATVILSAIIASIGLMRDNVAVIIGAMVVAPLLTPNMALAFAVTVGDLTFARKALRTMVVGVSVGLAFALLVGWLFPFEIGTEIRSRTEPAPVDMLLALASGAAGALAFTSGVSASLVGVMVAVALLPPLIVIGLMVAIGSWHDAAGATLLLAINTICVILAGVSTFAWRGVRPRTWWEKEKARKYTRRMLSICIAMAVALLALVGLADW
ncbi:MAG: TIGR00341 family protein [Planctomycetota bacterium]